MDNKEQIEHIKGGKRHVTMTAEEAKGTRHEMPVIEWGLSVCKYCYAAEGEWDDHDTCIESLRARQTSQR